MNDISTTFLSFLEKNKHRMWYQLRCLLLLAFLMTNYYHCVFNKTVTHSVKCWLELDYRFKMSIIFEKKILFFQENIVKNILQNFMFFLLWIVNWLKMTQNGDRITQNTCWMTSLFSCRRIRMIQDWLKTLVLPRSFSVDLLSSLCYFSSHCSIRQQD